jgi:hypothetical protein
MRYKRGDEIVLKVEDNFGYRDKVYSRVKVMIIGFDTDCDGDDAMYLCYVPCYETLPYGFNSFTIDHYHAKYFDLEDKFLGDNGCFITAKTPIFKHVPVTPGEWCDRCNEFFNHAEASDKKSYRCRACKENPWR